MSTPDRRVSVADAAEVLAVAALYDDREVSRLVAEEWARVLNEQDIEAHAAAAAVRRHYAERPDDRVKPGHVIAIVREWNHDRAERERTQRMLAEMREIEARPPGTGEGLAACRRVLAETPAYRAPGADGVWRGEPGTWMPRAVPPADATTAEQPVRAGEDAPGHSVPAESRTAGRQACRNDRDHDGDPE